MYWPPLKMNFNKRELIIFGAGALITIAIVLLSGAKKETPLEKCEHKKANCEAELDECIATQR